MKQYLLGSASLDFTARRTLMAAMGYYSLDIGLLSDAEFDGNCKLLQDRYEDLSKFRQFQFGPRDEMTTTGFHYKITLWSARATLDWALRDGKAASRALWFNRPGRWDDGGDWSNGQKFQWWNVGDFTWDQTARL